MLRLVKAVGVMIAVTASGAVAAATGTAPVDAAHEQWKMLNDYCVKCHNSTDWAGGTAFDVRQPEDIAQDGKVWEEAVTKLQGRLMPPPGEKQPPQPTI